MANNIVDLLFTHIFENLPKNEFRVSTPSVTDQKVSYTLLISYKNPASNPAGDTITLFNYQIPKAVQDRIAVVYDYRTNNIIVNVNHMSLNGLSTCWTNKLTTPLDDPKLIEKVLAIVREYDSAFYEKCSIYSENTKRYLNSLMSGPMSKSVESGLEHHPKDSDNT